MPCFMEYDDERWGDSSPLRHLPKGKITVLAPVVELAADVRG